MLAELGGRDGAWAKLCDVGFSHDDSPAFEETVNHYECDGGGQTLHLCMSDCLDRTDGAPIEWIARLLQDDVIKDLQEGDGGRLPDVRWEFACTVVFSKGDDEATDGKMYLATVVLPRPICEQRVNAARLAMWRVNEMCCDLYAADGGAGAAAGEGEGEGEGAGEGEGEGRLRPRWGCTRRMLMTQALLA